MYPLRIYLKVFDSALDLNWQQIAELYPEFEKKLVDCVNYFSRCVFRKQSFSDDLNLRSSC